VATKILFSPPLPKPIMDVARTMLPDGYELNPVDQAAPEYKALLAETEYWMGFARHGVDQAFFRAAPKLKLIQLISAGYDRIDLAAARQAGVPVSNNGGSNAIGVAEHTLMLMLTVLKRGVWLHGNVVAGNWRVGGFDEHRLYELAGKTVGIIGLGTIGKKVARRVRAFDAQVLYYDVLRLTEDQEDALGVRFALFEELLAASDIITLHVPLNESTHRFMGTDQFSAMKPGAILINTCRGPVVDEAALYQALTSGRIAAAGLDVMIEEPPRKDHPLFTLDNVIITPHMAGPTWENWGRAFRNAYDNIQRVAAGRPPLWVVPELRS
jgi:glyoxylate reductase/D-3-phosphoglycerate dehydrogenase